MKVTLEWPFRTFSGTLDETTFMSYRKGNLCLGRGWEKPEKTANNARLADIAHNLKSIWDNANPYFKEDLKKYIKQFKAQRLKPGKMPPGAYAVFMSMVYALQNIYPQIDLTTVTLAEIAGLNAPVRTVAMAVEAQLLVPVRGYEGLDNQL